MPTSEKLIPSSSSCVWSKPDDFWFGDGNVLLLASQSSNSSPEDNTSSTGVAFRVHAGVLSRFSNTLKERIDSQEQREAQRNELSGSDADIIGAWDTCKYALRFDDHPLDVQYTLKAIYDGLYFLDTEPRSFAVLGGILRIAQKYDIPRIHEIALDRLCEDYPTTVDGWDARELRCSSKPSSDSDDDGHVQYPSFTHPVHVIRLARELDLPQLLPCAFYDLARYKASTIVAGAAPLPGTLPTPSHHKAQNPLRNRALLSPTDMLIAVSLKESLIARITDFALNSPLLSGLPEHAPADSTHCDFSVVGSSRTRGDAARCANSFAWLSTALVRGLAGVEGDLGPGDALSTLSRAVHIHSSRASSSDEWTRRTIGGACGGCRGEFRRQCAVERERCWRHMLEMLGLEKPESEPVDGEDVQ